MLKGFRLLMQCVPDFQRVQNHNVAHGKQVKEDDKCEAGSEWAPQN